MTINPALAKSYIKDENLTNWLNELGATDADVAKQDFVKKAQALYPHRDGAAAAGITGEQLLNVAKNWSSERVSSFAILIEHGAGAKAAGITAEQLLDMAKYAVERVEYVHGNWGSEIPWTFSGISNLAKLIEHGAGAKAAGIIEWDLLSPAQNGSVGKVLNLAKLIEYGAGAKAVGITGQQLLKAAENLSLEQASECAKKLKFTAKNEGEIGKCTLENKTIANLIMSSDVTPEQFEGIIQAAAPQSQTPESAEVAQEQGKTAPEPAI